MSISTKNIPTGGSSVSKTLQPGNAVVKINDISLEPFTYKEGAYHLILHLEGTDRGPEFEGFFINKDRPELGRYKGQVARVKASEWAYADGETKSGIKISRDTEILKFISNLCKEVKTSWLEEADGKYDTIEAFVKGFNQDKPFKDIWFNFCIAGKEYQNKEGYTAYDLFLPKYVKGMVSFEVCDKADSKIMKFNEAEHIKKRKVETVTEFGNAPAGTSNDFEL
jgi:hypothetical protein